MVEGGATPVQGADDLQRLGYSIVIFPGGIVRALAKHAGDYYASLRAHGSNQPFGTRMYDFEGLNHVLGTDELLAEGKRYETGRAD
jgi:2-methylisocitrate lyase-like PEP mutase family enzyme